MIYFIRDPLTKRVKIGVSYDPWKRLAYIQIGCPTDLELVAAIEGDARDETALHQRFAQYRVRGEWFAETAELAGFVATLPRPLRPIPPRYTREPATPFDRWLLENRVNAQEFARSLGFSHSFISHMRRGRRQPTLDVACQLADLTGLHPRDFIVITPERLQRKRAA